MAYVMVDVEADGPIPGDYSMVCFGAVLVKEGLDQTFYGRLEAHLATNGSPMLWPSAASPGRRRGLRRPGPGDGSLRALGEARGQA